jgi:hypothetical protein
MTIETWLKKSNVQLLWNNITPGACKEMYSILGLPKFYDQTFTRNNTLRLIPNPSSNSSNLAFMRGERIGYIKNITTSPLEGDKGWLNVKLEFYTSSSSEL